MLQNARMTWNPLRNSQPTRCKISRKVDKLYAFGRFLLSLAFSYNCHNLFNYNVLRHIRLPHRFIGIGCAKAR
jgi:hypothetical protein